MKNVFILPDSRSCWDKIGEYLSSVNARVDVLDPALSPEELREKAPSLFVVGEKHGTSQLLYRLREYATIIIREGGTPGLITPPADNNKLATAVWPIGKNAFLRFSAEMARLSERRLFKAIVRLFPTGCENAFIGQSIDFSQTGMAFRAGQSFNVGDLLEVALSLPSRGDSVTLPVEVMRIVDGEKETTYGARFTEMDMATRSQLRGFVAGS